MIPGSSLLYIIVVQNNDYLLCVVMCQLWLGLKALALGGSGFVKSQARPKAERSA
jgi:hypothetical protein